MVVGGWKEVKIAAFSGISFLLLRYDDEQYDYHGAHHSCCFELSVTGLMNLNDHSGTGLCACPSI